MRRLIGTRPSPAMMVALVALFVALGGSSYAALKISGKQIKNNTVSTKDIKNNNVRSKDVRNNTLKGADINESTLGIVPNATNAANATNATNAAFAGLANRANSAATVDQIKVPGSYKKVTSSASATPQTAARAAATEVPIFSHGAFDIYGKCFIDEAQDPDQLRGEVLIRTRQDGSIVEADENAEFEGANGFLDTNTPEEDRILIVTDRIAGETNIDDLSDNDFFAAASDGTSFTGHVDLAIKFGDLPGSEGVYGTGDVCIFAGYGIG